MKWSLRARLVVAGAMVGAVLSSGCGMMPVACTEIGCRSGVVFSLGDQTELFVVDRPVQIRACIDEACTTDTLTVTTQSAGSARVFGTEHFELDLDNRTLRYNTGNAEVGEDPKRVSLELTREGAVVLDEARENVGFQRSQPNGPSCEPVCWNASVSL